jgi:hypothetical protein
MADSKIKDKPHDKKDNFEYNPNSSSNNSGGEISM